MDYTVGQFTPKRIAPIVIGPPLAGDRWGRALTIEGRPLPPPGQGIEVTFRVSRPDYFQTMGIAFNNRETPTTGQELVRFTHGAGVFAAAPLVMDIRHL